MRCSPSSPCPPASDPLAGRRAAWSALHHGIDPTGNPVLDRWLRGVWVLARPLVRLGVPPTAVTGAGVLLGCAAATAAPHRPAVAAGLVIAAGVCDNLDGAVAVLTDGATPAGARADALADRATDVLFAAALGRCGAPRSLATACATVAVSVDLLRRVLRRPATVTVGERPSWTVCAALACAARARSARRWPVLACVFVWLGLGVTALCQLARTGSDRPALPGERAGAASAQ